MTDVYLGIGHGIKPDKGYDPGACTPKGTQEHVLASSVVAAAAGALARSGVSAIVERGYNSHGEPDDPNYVGSTTAANAAGVKRAVEVHFDWTQGVVGYAGQYSGSTKSLALSKAIATRFAEMGLPVAKNAHVNRKGTLYFLDHTTMPALIPEMTVVSDTITADTLVTMGEAVAAGLCDDLGKTYVPGGGDDVSDLLDALDGNGMSAQVFADNMAWLDCYRLARDDPSVKLPAKLEGTKSEKWGLAGLAAGKVDAAKT